MKLSRPLSKNESNLIKGVAILMIIFHNYFHIIPPSPGENQFAFDSLNFDRFKQLLIADPLSIIRYSFSYFGHYGVQLFIFISGYGLYISSKNKEISYFSFLGQRIKKLYPTLLIIVFFLMIAIPIWEQKINLSTIKSLLLKLTLLFNFIPGEAMSVTGPFWFFSLIVQLYIIFPLLAYSTKKFGSVSVLLIGAVSLVITIFFNNYFDSPDVSFYFLFIGQLPVFCLGIFFASKRVIHLSTNAIIVAIIIFSLGNINEIFWYFSFPAFTIFMLAFFPGIFSALGKRKNLYSFLLYSGSISLYLFAVHGIARFPFEFISEKYDNALITSTLSLVYLAGTFFLAWLTGLFDKKVQAVV
ncbi:MAG: acyltransferase [Ginsengibacter sp.]|jgi:peptidoglycan/LPS O-acetylase OafA/YrhL